jgi:uncharacterized protein YjcR
MNDRRIFTDNDIRQIRKDWKTGKYKQWQLANKYGCTQTLISMIILKKRYKNVKD